MQQWGKKKKSNQTPNIFLLSLLGEHWWQIGDLVFHSGYLYRRMALKVDIWVLPEAASAASS